MGSAPEPGPWPPAASGPRKAGHPSPLSLRGGGTGASEWEGRLGGPWGETSSPLPLPFPSAKGALLPGKGGAERAAGWKPHGTMLPLPVHEGQANYDCVRLVPRCQLLLINLAKLQTFENTLCWGGRGGTPSLPGVQLLRSLCTLLCVLGCAV